MKLFNLDFPKADELKKAADLAITKCLGVKKDETVLIVTNPNDDVYKISQALYNSALTAEAKVTLLIQPMKTQLDNAEDSVIAAIKTEPDVLISMSHEKIGKDYRAQKDPYKHDGKLIDNTFHYLMAVKKTRAFWSPSVTFEQFIKTVPVDYERMKKESLYLKSHLDQGKEVLITCPNGTDLKMGIKNRIAFLDNGDFTAPGAGGNLPAGESFVSPELKTSNGTIAFRGSISVTEGVLVLPDPVKVEVKDGFITEIEQSKNGQILEQSLINGKKLAMQFAKSGKFDKATAEEYARNAYNLGELGIGINPEAKVIGNMLIDEKAYNTCHIAIGSNYDEDARALIHLDGLIQNPTIKVVKDDNSIFELVKDGQLMI